MNQKTALILCAAGGLVAAATVFTQTSSPQASAVVTKTTEPKPVAVAKEAACGGDPQPALASSSFTSGRLNAALSSQKLLQGSTGDLYLAVDLSADTREIAERPPLSLAIVIDRSGSMQGEKLVQAKSAAAGIVDRLSAQDFVAVVQYDDDAQVIFPSTSMDPMGKARAKAQIEQITDDGSTNLHDGLALGRDEVLRASPGTLKRVILLSDGVANAGITHPPTLNNVAGTAADQGVRITTIGLGLDYNEDLMESLAEHGRGQYYYVQNAADLDGVFRGELQNIQSTVATNTEIRLTPLCDGVEIAEVYGYNSTRQGRDMVVPLADLFGGDARKMVVRLRVPAGQLGAVNAVRVTMSYDDAKTKQRQSVELALGVEVSGDSVAVDSSANKDVIAQAMEVESARAMREAAAAYETGDVDRAMRLNKAWRQEAEKKAMHFGLGDAEMNEVYGELDSQAQGIQMFAPASADGKAMIKGSKAKARDFSKRK